MGIALIIILLAIGAITSCAQEYQYPGPLEIKTYRIGQKVDTTQFINRGSIYFPNYLDGWTMDNYDQLPEEYYGLPIAIWQSRTDSGIALTLLNNVVLNITVSYIANNEKQQFVEMATRSFGGPGIAKSHEESHPLQEWITYWNLETWETSGAVFQVGNSDMRKPKDPKPAEVSWNLAYSDLQIEDKLIAEYKKLLFSNRDDSIKFQRQLATHKNRLHPPENGLFTDYHENGALKERGNYKNGLKEGLWETWYDNGQKEDSAIYKEDDLIGTRIMWFANGQLQLVSQWSKTSERIGKWTRYYENGRLESVGGFNEKGDLHGKHVQYFSNGKVKREITYENGREIEDILYNEEGKRNK